MNNTADVNQSPSASSLSQGERRNQPLRSSVKVALEKFFDDIGDHQPGDLYRMVIGEVEQAMLQSVMNYANGNQTRAAEILGINRSTLRKKLKQYHLD